MRFLLVLFLLFQVQIFAKVSLRGMISQMLIVTFNGQKSKDENAVWIKQQIDNGNIGGVVISKKNIILKSELRSLIKFLKKDTPTALAVLNHGLTLKKEDGFLPFISNRDVANEYDILKAKKYYEKKAKEIKNIGIDYILEPHVNMGDFNQSNTFSKEAEIVSTYANIYINAFEKYNILTGVNFFPIDKNTSWDYELLRPFYDLIQEKKAKSIILGCYPLKDFNESIPSCMSKQIVQSFLINEFKYKGIIVADLRELSKKELAKGVLKALSIGVNMFILNYNSKDINDIKDTVMQDVYDKKLDKEVIKKSYKKVLDFKKGISL